MTTKAAMTTVSLVALAACKEQARPELPSITPAEPSAGYLFVPAEDHYFAVVAELSVPTGYQAWQDLGEAVHFKRYAGEPEISVSSTISGRPGDYKPDRARLSKCDSPGSRVVRDEPRNNGRMTVCRYRFEMDDRAHEGIDVIRNHSWREHEFQCVVQFRSDGDVFASFDNGEPSASRLNDAVAICDSLKIREATPKDFERFFPERAKDLRDTPREDRYERYPPTH